MDVFPIPPAPIRAIGVRLLCQTDDPVDQLIRPKKTLGRGGGRFPRHTRYKSDIGSLGVEISDLF
jgi:hypothetical protein